MLFPSVLWGDTQATFLAAGEVLPEAPLTAALVFAMQHEDFILADIEGRGWCIPGGHLEVEESGEQAARREVREEIGATLGPLHLLGHYVLTSPASQAEANQIETSKVNGGAGKCRLVVAYLAYVLELDALPPGSESRGILRCPYADLQTHYYTWDALLAAMFAYAHFKSEELNIRG